MCIRDRSLTIGDALAHVHERTDAEGRPLDIVHRDLSPQNVMIGYGGDVKLIDFGTARGENRRCHTVSGVVFAKPGYVAPEVANNTPGFANTTPETVWQRRFSPRAVPKSMSFTSP